MRDEYPSVLLFKAIAVLIWFVVVVFLTKDRPPEPTPSRYANFHTCFWKRYAYTDEDTERFLRCLEEQGYQITFNGDPILIEEEDVTPSNP